jgi:hypothetical protein
LQMSQWYLLEALLFFLNVGWVECSVIPFLPFELDLIRLAWQ